VIGMSLHEAVNTLEAAGFNVSIDDTGFGNRVTAYSPQGQASQGSTITITVGFQF
jgi:beta-lactam-binding protein with PASTA domain